jgi:hypothetical protein
MPSLVLRSTMSVAFQSPMPWRRCWRKLAPFSGGMVSHALLHAGQRWAGRHIGPDRNLESSTVVHGQRGGLQVATNEWPGVGCWALEAHMAALVRSPLRSGQVLSAFFEQGRVHGLVNETLPIVMGGIDLLLGDRRAVPGTLDLQEAPHALSSLRAARSCIRRPARSRRPGQEVGGHPAWRSKRTGGSAFGLSLTSGRESGRGRSQDSGSGAVLDR